MTKNRNKKNMVLIVIQIFPNRWQSLSITITQRFLIGVLILKIEKKDCFVIELFRKKAILLSLHIDVVLGAIENNMLFYNEFRK